MNNLVIIPTQELAFARDRIADRYIANLDGHERYIPTRLFWAIFPRVDKRRNSGTLEASARQLEALGVIAEIIDPVCQRIVYELRSDRGDNYEVNHVVSGQRLVIAPMAFRRITNADPRVQQGTMCVSDTQLADIGFIIGRGVKIERSNQYINYA